MEWQQLLAKKWVRIGLVVFFILIILGGLWYLFGRGTRANNVIEEIFSFGASVSNNPQESGANLIEGTTNSGQDRNKDGIVEEPMFRQLASVQVAGAYALKRGGVPYVRYIEKETGHAYEVNLSDGAGRQLTQTTIPRIALADWALDGNAVILRSLERDAFSGRDVVKTRLGRLPVAIPTRDAQGSVSATQADSDLSSASSSFDRVGAMKIEPLPDNIIALSVAPDGKDLFYLIKNANGVSGSIINLETRATKAVFQNALSEWSPQMLSDGTIILTTKPSGEVAGYSYRYDPKTKALERLVREKNGLTTLGTGSGSRVLYGENIAKNSTLGVYSKSGFAGDEGTVFYEKTVSLATLPEKCAWLSDGIRLLCGSFVNTPSGLIPDLWYQGRLSFSDTFWSLDTNTDEIAYLADPKTEAGQEFDVTNPIVSTNEEHFIFTNKKDGTLWSMRVPKKEVPAEETETLPSNLSPAELQDAKGSEQGNLP
ncbi:MAG: hypothetical protein AAB869_02695 [Patescibacteria group bacterium]